MCAQTFALFKFSEKYGDFIVAEFWPIDKIEIT